MSIATWVKKKILVHELFWKCQGYQNELAFLGFHFLVHSFHLDLCIFFFTRTLSFISAVSNVRWTHQICWGDNRDKCYKSVWMNGIWLISDTFPSYGWSECVSLFSVELLASLQNISPAVVSRWGQILFIKYRKSMGESRSFCLCHHLHSCLQAVGFKQSFTFHMIMQIQSCSCALAANTLLRSFLKQSSSYFWILLLSVSATKKVFCSLLATHIHTHAFSVIHTRCSCCRPWLTTVP